MNAFRYIMMIVIVLMLAITPAHGTNSKSNNDWRDTCAAMQRLAKSIMTARQNGFAMSDMMSKSDASGDAIVKKLDESLIIYAYSLPRYSTNEMQQKSIEDFGNDTYLQCAKQHMK